MASSGRVYDELLVLLAGEGDRRALERLALRWHKRLLRSARRITGDDELAREAVQQSWVGIVAGLRRLNDPARFPAWAFSILHRRCADRIGAVVAARGRDGELNQAAEPAGTAGIEDRLDLNRAFGALPPEQRVAATLFFGEQLALAEIAEATGVPVGTVKSRIFAARKFLKSHLKGD